MDSRGIQTFTRQQRSPTKHLEWEILEYANRCKKPIPGLETRVTGLNGCAKERWLTGCDEATRLLRQEPVRRGVHAYETHAREVYAHEMHAREVHTHEAHTCDVHAHEMHAREAHAHETPL